MIKDVHFSGPRTPCKICAGSADLYGVVDFNKSCREAENVFLPLLGVPVYYHRCDNCGLIFSNAFDQWSAADFQNYIYNAAYAEVDPEHTDVHPRKLADMVFSFIKGAGDLRVLDYGGGTGLTAAVLRDKGIAAISWDPMREEAQPVQSRFDLVTCFEVFEHTATPRSTAENALTFLDHKGVLLFSTLAIDTLTPRDAGFWYIAPRNGHITLYSPKSLQALFAPLDCNVHHFNDNVHMAYRTLPAWLSP